VAIARSALAQWYRLPQGRGELPADPAGCCPQVKNRRATTFDRLWQSHTVDRVPRHVPIMATPVTRVSRHFVGASLVGVCALLLGLFTVAKAVYLDGHGMTVRAEVVEASLGGRAEVVRVRLADPPGRVVKLWAWRGSPAVGQTLTVVYDGGTGWAKEAGSFAPAWLLWSTSLGAVWFLGVAWFMRPRGARRRLADDGFAPQPTYVPGNVSQMRDLAGNSAPGRDNGSRPPTAEQRVQLSILARRHQRGELTNEEYRTECDRLGAKP
jgi:hypothetical protein